MERAFAAFMALVVVLDICEENVSLLSISIPSARFSFTILIGGRLTSIVMVVGGRVLLVKIMASVLPRFSETLHLEHHAFR